MENNITKKIRERIDEKKRNREEQEKLSYIRNAHREWINKQEYFNSVNDFDLVDFAIYDMEASKLKYIYLLKKMKEEKKV